MNELLYFVITIGILVFVHEFGHFAAAKICKMRTEVFAIGFGKRLFGWNKINGFTFGNLPDDIDLQGHTDYRISLIPLGGYVKIAGMVDESFDTNYAQSEPKPWEFRAKPAYMKFFAISAGVLMNLLLTIGIFWGINFFEGKPVYKTTQVMVTSDTSKAAIAGFEDGDKILSVNNNSVSDWQQLMEEFLIESVGDDLSVTVQRNDTNKVIKIDKNLVKGMKPENFFLSIGHRKVLAAQMVEDSPAELADFQPQDTVIAINGIRMNSKERLTEVISANPGTELNLTLKREDRVFNSKIVPDSSGKLGVYLADVYTGPYEYQTFGAFESLSMAFGNLIEYTGLTFIMAKKVFSGSIEFGQAFGGPKKIAEYAAKSAETGPSSFIMFIAMLSLSLAIINILPFPALDGGHLVIIIIEAVARREIPLKAKIAIQNIGFFVLLGLMALIIYTDFFG